MDTRLLSEAGDAGDWLWIISRHDQGGYAAPNNGNGHDPPTCGQTSTSALYGGYVHHSHGQAPPSNGYGYGSISMADMLLLATDMILLNIYGQASTRMLTIAMGRLLPAMDGYASTSHGGFASLSYGYDPPNKFFPSLVKFNFCCFVNF